LELSPQSSKRNAIIGNGLAKQGRTNRATWRAFSGDEASKEAASNRPWPARLREEEDIDTAGR
jgi:hypothetical protein